MKAVQITEPGRIEIIDTQKPVLESDNVVVKMNSLGLCGSDLKSYQGTNPLVSYPIIPGHEIAGTIVELGSAIQAKDLLHKTVTVSPYTSCGNCSACRKGKVNCCKYNQTLGVQRNGAALEYISVPADKLIFPGDLREELTTLIEPLSVGFHAVNRIPRGSVETVLVFGCGLVGIGSIVAAAELGMHVIAADIDNDKLNTAKAFGAAEILNSGNSDFLQQVFELTNGEGPDAVIEAVGLPETFKLAVELVNFGGFIVYIGYVKDMVSYETKLFVSKELTIMGSRNALKSDFKQVIQIMTVRGEDFLPLVTKVFPLDQALEAFQYWEKNRSEIFKIVLTVHKKNNE
jgi:L-galactonate 5-dehydrogenase